MLPDEKNSRVTITEGIKYIVDIPLTEMIKEWHDRNNAAHNQILLCISPKLQIAINGTDIAAIAWMILVNKFESKDPSKISIIRTRYKNYHMTDGQLVTSYLMPMKEFRSQLERMGEAIPDFTHAATILHNVPESWRSIAQTIQMISNNVNKIKDKLKAHEADLNAIEISDQAATAFITWYRQPQNSVSGRYPTTNYVESQSTNRNSPTPIFNPNQVPTRYADYRMALGPITW